MGGLLAFRVGNYDNTAEREQFRFLCEQLKSHYEDSNEFCVFAGNYNIGCELDALFIKKDAIISIEFKNYGGHVIANENGEWTCDGVTIKGGSRKTVLQQARINHSIVKKELKALGVDKNQIKDVPHLVVFHQNISLENRLSATNKSWLHITDNAHFVEKLADITCPHTDLDSLGIVNLAELLNLNSFYLTEFSNATYDKPTTPPERLQLFEDIKAYEGHVNEESPKFIDGPTCDSNVVDTSKQKSSQEVDELDNLQTESDSREGYGQSHPQALDEERQELYNFVDKILKQILKRENCRINVFYSKDAQPLFDSYSVKFTKQFLITVESEGIGAQCLKLGRFINHEVRAINPNLIYWEDGEALDSGTDLNTPMPIAPITTNKQSAPEIHFRKYRTVLPHWIDRKIFADLGAIYAPEHKRYEYNLNLNDDELKVYLGTYFPRSYAEMFCILDNLLCNKSFKTGLTTQINVLDCGCGTGGELLGLVTAISKHHSNSEIVIDAFDGNEKALLILENILEDFPKKEPQIHLTTSVQTFASEKDLKKISTNSQGKKYDFILCDKMVCELISKSILSPDGYAIIAKSLTPLLSERGLLIILDVTTKDEHCGHFYPELMNKALNDYIRDNRAIETLLPLSCAQHKDCKDLCFMQQTFVVSHSHKSEDESRVCYRILCNKTLKDCLLQDIDIVNVTHVIHPIRYKQNDQTAICKFSVLPQKTDKIIDSFNINQ